MLQSSLRQQTYVITHTEGGAEAGVAYMRAKSQSGEAVNLLLRKVGDRFNLEQMLLAARDWCELDHGPVARLHDVGMVDQETVFFAYQPLAGLSLQQIIAQQGAALSPDRVLALFHDALKSLDYLRRQGLSHNNITLQHIIITPDKHLGLDMPLPKLIDDMSPPSVFAPDRDISFLAPERLQRSSSNDLVSDCYAMGVCLFTALLRRPLLAMGDREEMLARQRAGSFDPESPVLHSLEERYRKVLRCALHVDRHHRYHIPNDFRHDVNMLIGNHQPDRAHKILSFGDAESEELLEQDGSRSLDVAQIDEKLAALKKTQDRQQRAPSRATPQTLLNKFSGLTSGLKRLITVSPDGMEAKDSFGAWCGVSRRTLAGHSTR